MSLVVVAAKSEARRSSPRRPPVLIVGNFLSAAGASRGVCEDLVVRLRSAGWNAQATSALPGRVRRLADMLLTVWSRRSQYAVAQVDVYSGPAFFWALSVTELLRMVGKPYVLTLHGGRLPQFSARWPRVVQRVLSRARAVTTPSRYLLREMRPYRGDMVELPNPLDLAAYPFSIRSKPRPALVWLRAFQSTYNPSLAPEVLALLAVDFPDVTLTMIGPDRGDGSLDATWAAADRLGVRGRLKIVLGVPKEKVGGALSGADIFLNTTNADNTPVSVLEAMACGLCVVSTNVGGLPDLIDEGRNGILVAPSDPGAMAQAVRALLTDGGLAERLSREGRARAEGCDWTVVLPEWERLLTEAARV